jgi:hypothetical protein
MTGCRVGRKTAGLSRPGTPVSISRASRAMLAGLALVSKEARRMAMAATTLFTIGAGATCTDGVCAR